MGKTVNQIIIDRFLKDVEEKGTMPWQRPYEVRYNAFNYFSLQPYKGINKLMLPFGEYLTANQINEYNKKNNEDFKFQKGIEWFPVVFFKNDIKKLTNAEIKELIKDPSKISEGDYLGKSYGWDYWFLRGEFIKQRKVMQYFSVAERMYFKNSKGDYLPSRVELGDVEITKSSAKEVVNSYIKRSGVGVITDFAGVPDYTSSSDTVRLNPSCSSEDIWFSNAFHELAHSTGIKERLNRIGITLEGIDLDDESLVNELYNKEEIVAEICSYLCCQECGVYSSETSGSACYANNVAYVKAYKSMIESWGKDFIYLVSQADKAFNYIMNFT